LFVLVDVVKRLLVRLGVVDTCGCSSSGHRVPCVGQSRNWKIFVEVGKLALVRAQEVVVLTVYTIIDMT